MLFIVSRSMRVLLLALLVCVVLLASVASVVVRSAPVSPGSIYWGVLIDGVPFDMSRLDAFEKRAHKQVSIVHWGQPWMSDGAFQSFQTAQFEAVRAHGSIPMIDWGSWEVGSGIDQPHFTLQEIYKGQYDDYIREWASDAKAWGHPLFLRFDHEMNGWWFPWAEQVNNNQPGDYVKAWRHIHDIFAQVGATNVTWVWCPNVIDSPQSTPVAGLYPGDAYVDWVAMDGYDRPSYDPNVPGQSFYDVFKLTYDKLVSLAPSKPLMIAEVASSEQPNAHVSPDWKAAWIRDAFVQELPIEFPRVKAIVWFDWNDNNPQLDWPIASSQASIDAFAQSIASPHYASNEFRHLDVSPIPPPG